VLGWLLAAAAACGVASVCAQAVTTAAGRAEVEVLEAPAERQVSLGWSLAVRGEEYTQARNDAITACYDSAFADARADDDALLDSFTPVALVNYTATAGDGIVVNFYTNIDRHAESSVGALILLYSESGLSRCTGDASLSLVRYPETFADGRGGFLSSATRWAGLLLSGVLVSSLPLVSLWMLSRRKPYDAIEISDQYDAV